MRHVSSLLAATLGSALLISCTGGSAGPSADANVAGDVKAALTSAKVVNTSCYYAALPGAFRMYCPGPKDKAGCGSIPSGLQVAYENSDGTSGKAAARGVTPAESTAMPETCMAFDLNLLPNASNKLNYKIGSNEFHVFSYMAYGDGQSVP